MKRIIALLALIAIFLTGCGKSNDSSIDPFGHIYRVSGSVDDVFAVEAIDDVLLVNLSSFHNLFIMNNVDTYDFELMGEFKECELDNEDERNGLWIITQDNETTPSFELAVDKSGSIFLSQIAGETIQRTYPLIRVDMVSVNVSTFGTREHLEIDWFYHDTFPGDLSMLSSGTIQGKGKIGFSVEDEDIDTIKVIEEYYANGSVEHTEYNLSRAEGFSISVNTKYEGNDQYAIYRIPDQMGEYVFYIKYV